jgi:hypothetical protein
MQDICWQKIQLHKPLRQAQTVRFCAASFLKVIPRPSITQELSHVHNVCAPQICWICILTTSQGICLHLQTAQASEKEADLIYWLTQRPGYQKKTKNVKGPIGGGNLTVSHASEKLSKMRPEKASWGFGKRINTRTCTTLVSLGWLRQQLNSDKERVIVCKYLLGEAWV